MPRELEENSKTFCDPSYENACSEMYNKLDFSSLHIQDGQENPQNEYEIPSKVHFNEYEGTGDSQVVIQEASELIPYESQINEPQVYDYNYDETSNSEKYVQELPWESSAPLSCGYPSMPFDRQYMKIRYTRQYLLNCQRSPLSIAFPDCLLKYVDSNEVPLKQMSQEIPFYDCRNMDHIVFYKSLPYTRMKHTLSNCNRRKAIF